MTIRQQRALRNIGGFSGGIARPPQKLPEPDVRPGPSVVEGNYYIDTGAEDNQYGLLHADLPLTLVFDEDTEEGAGPQIDWDPPTSVSFFHVGTDIVIRQYTAGGGGGNPDTGYLLVLWDQPASANGATLKIQFYSDAFTLQEEYTATNTDDAYSAILLLPNDVTLAAGSLILMEITFANGMYGATEHLYAETWLHWTEA